MDKDEATELVRKNYSYNLTYLGNEFFHKYYMGLIVEESRKVIAGRSHGVYEYSNDLNSNFQENYLGYLPSDDIFISGWDIWMEVDIYSLYVAFHKGRVISKVRGKELPDYSITYNHRDPRNSGLTKLHKLFPDLIDIRLN